MSGFFFWGVNIIMTTFKQFLAEEIYVKGDDLVIATQAFRSASSKEAISTYFRSQPYETRIRGCDADVYSLMNYVSSEVTTNILKSLKGSGPYHVNEKQFAGLMKQIREAAAKVVKRVNPTVIIYPKSKSDLLKQFVDEVKASAPNAIVLNDSFIKSALDAEDVEPLINTDHPDWVKFAETHPKDVEKLKKQLKTHIQKGELELKKLYKPYLKFIKNFIELKNAYDVLDKVLGEKVLVVDDILSSGSTMAEMIRQLQDLEPSKIVGLTMFKHTVSAKE